MGCVDNHLARIALSQAQGLLWLDCGNSYTGLQVCIGNAGDRDMVLRCIQSDRYTSLPNAGLLFPQLLEPERVEPAPAIVPPPDASCADRTETGSQALLVNDLAGIVAGEYLYKLLNGLPVLSFVTFADTETLSMRSVSITAENLKQYLDGVKSSVTVEKSKNPV